MNRSRRIKAARDYFRLADQGRPEVLDLSHEDAEIYFPKFGFGFGRQSFLEMTNGFAGTLEFIRHDYDAMTFIPAGDYVVVEGYLPRQDLRKSVDWRSHPRRSFLQRLQVSWRSHFESPRLS